MESLYDDAEAALCRQRHADVDADLADRVYTSRLLGSDPTLVLHGGGNTSVKGQTRDVEGELTDVLWVKGSGWDLASIQPAGFAQCRLEPLRRYCRLPQLSDEAMVAALRSQMLDPSGPTPSVEALLHAHLPGKFVDHTHANAALAIVDQPDARERAREAWGAEALFLPYVAPGFLLARRVAELGIDDASPPLLILEKHGVFTWGNTARESYDRTLRAIAAAQSYLRERRRPTASVSRTVSLRSVEARLRLGPALRGAAASEKRGPRFLIEWRETPQLREFLGGASAREIAMRGCITPDHAIRTKPFPAWLTLPEDGLEKLDDAAVERLVRRCFAEFAQEYESYFDQHAGRSESSLERLDSLPRIVAVPGLGIAALGLTRSAARVAADLFENAVSVMAAAERLGTYQPVSRGELFDVEYWSLEQAKLGKRKPAGALAGRVALVTGAASGIGLATAQHFLSLGAHAMLVDRDADALTRVQADLGGVAQFETQVADLTERAAAEGVVQATTLAFGGLDIVVSNAGNAPSGALHDAGGTESLSASLELNLMSHQRMAAAAARPLARQGTGGCLLFNASKSAFNPGPLFGPYAVAKSALVALMKQYAIDLAPFGVRANAVNADRVRTGLFSPDLVARRARARGTTPEAYFQANLLGRETLASDVAEAFAYLAGANATTGAVVTVDGGNPAAFPR